MLDRTMTLNTKSKTFLCIKLVRRIKTRVQWWCTMSHCCHTSILTCTLSFLPKGRFTQGHLRGKWISNLLHINRPLWPLTFPNFETSYLTKCQVRQANIRWFYFWGSLPSKLLAHLPCVNQPYEQFLFIVERYWHASVIWFLYFLMS
jgi:hypothetical protein